MRLETRVTLSQKPAPYPYGSLPHYESGDILHVPAAEFEALLQHPIPNGKWNGLLEENDALCQMSYARSGVARLAYRILNRLKKKSEDAGKPDLNILFAYNMPFRAIGKMSGGMVSKQMVDDILFIVNGHFWRGMGRLIRDFFRNKKLNRQFAEQIGG